jgi:hypothetical protein
MPAATTPTHLSIVNTHPKDERSQCIRQYITDYEAGDDISDSEKPTGSTTWTATIDWEPDKEANKGEDLFREDEGLSPKMYWCITGD